MNTSLAPAMFLDAFVVIAAAALLLRAPGVRHSHPAVLYLIFHLLVVTSRGLAVLTGAPTLFTKIPALEAVTAAEVARAVLVADLFLVAATAGWLRAATRARPRGPGSEVRTSSTWLPLQTRYIVGVAVVAIPLGLFCIARYAYVPGSDNALVTVRSSYVTLAVTWPGLMLIALIYRFGFRSYLMLPLSGYLLLVSLQGYSRFRLVLPVVLLCQIYLDRRGRKWPGVRPAALLLVLACVFIPLKDIGRGVQRGDSIQEIEASAEERLSNALRGRDDDQALLDQLAAVLTLADQHQKVYLGRPYANVLVLPVPRELWPGKPGLADYLSEISTPARPLGTIGSITTLPGDLYVNFRLPGVIALGYLLALGSGRFFQRAYQAGYGSTTHLVYLLLACNLVQVYRDGLLSVPLFLLVQMLPLLVVLGLHYRGLSPARYAVAGQGAAGSVRLGQPTAGSAGAPASRR